jgi:drug/metabolite transporter (DMT)-like permease
MSVVTLHILFVLGAAILLKDYVTDFSTYVSTLAVFLPVFGAYVGIVVQDLGIEPQRSRKKVSNAFVYIVFALLVAYCVGVVIVMIGFTSGFIENEQSLPAAVAAVETAFGAFLTTCFFKLFKDEAKPT